MEPVSESLKALLALNWTVEHAEVDAPQSHRGSTRRQSKPNVVRMLQLPVQCPNNHLAINGYWGSRPILSLKC